MLAENEQVTLTAVRVILQVAPSLRLTESLVPICSSDMIADARSTPLKQPHAPRNLEAVEQFEQTVGASHERWIDEALVSLANILARQAARRSPRDVRLRPVPERAG